MNISWLADKIEQWPTDRLVPYARNARTHTQSQVAQIAASIAEFGFTNPILAGSDGVIVAGHGRLAAAQKLGIGTVPVVVLDHLTPTQRRALVIADNRITENAGWDEAMLHLELAALHDEDFDLTLTGFDADALADLLSGEEKTIDGRTDEDAVPEPAAAVISRTGDLWLLGPHRLMCGDSTRLSEVRVLMEDRQADLLHIDPPYGVAYSGRGSRTAECIKNDELAGPELAAFLAGAFANADAHLKEGAACYVWHADGHHGTRPIFEYAFKAIGWRLSCTLIWAKNQASMGWQDYRQQHEPCLYGWKLGEHRAVTDRTQTTLWQVKRDPAMHYVHPTQKPVELAERAIRNSTVAGAVVLDLFGGSGSTLIAAEKLGRVACLMELDPKYVDVIVRRWQDFSGAQAIRQSDRVPFDDLSGGGELRVEVAAADVGDVGHV